MGNIFSGSILMIDLFAGTTPVNSVYSGNIEVWHRGGPGPTYYSITFSNDCVFNEVSAFSSLCDDGRTRSWTLGGQTETELHVGPGEILASGFDSGDVFTITFANESSKLTYVPDGGSEVTLTGAGPHQITVNSNILVTKADGLYVAQPLCFTAQQSGSIIRFRKRTYAPTLSLESSTDGVNFTTYNQGQVTLQNIGDKLYIRAGSNGNTRCADSVLPLYANTFFMTGLIKASGDVTTLLNKNGLLDLTGRTYAFTNLFNGCTSLTQAPELPATTLADNCYYGMFSGCTSLTQAPELPATIIADSCYFNMFNGCTSLTQAPALPATTLFDNCYYGMFQGCSSLSTTHELSATTVANGCYSNMFRATALRSAPHLPAEIVGSYSYYGMFAYCTSLTSYPALPATTLANNCYEEMFMNCTSLTSAPALPATEFAEYCYSEMFLNCSALTHAPVISATNANLSYCCMDMFNGCTNIKIAEHIAPQGGYVVFDFLGGYSTYLTRMFENTGGTFTGTPASLTKYYCYT